VIEEQAVLGERSPAYDIHERTAQLDAKKFLCCARPGPRGSIDSIGVTGESLQLMLRGAAADLP